jgi:mediator of RNA polymerase II transcription subunit 12
VQALLPVTDNPDTVPPVLPEILLLAEDPNPEAPSLLANNLWYKYRTAPTWAWVVWDNAVASLRQVPVLTSEKTSREACALQYGTFLLHVDQHLPSGLDAQILDWFVGTGKNEVAALSSEAWDVLAFVLVFLAIHGAVTITTILQGLVYPAWQLAVAGQSGNPSATFLAAVHQITKRLLLQGDESATDPPVRDLLDDQRLRTRRLDVFREPHFSLLTASIPTLVLIENNPAISEDLRASSRSLRLALCHCPEFHEGVNRNLVAVHDAFEKSLQSEENAGGNGDCIIDALRWIWYDSHPGICASNVDRIILLM